MQRGSQHQTRTLACALATQVLDTKGEALKDALYEEAVILKRREMDYK